MQSAQPLLPLVAVKLQSPLEVRLMNTPSVKLLFTKAPCKLVRKHAVPAGSDAPLFWNKLKLAVPDDGATMW
jgi:hypothetical protein